VSANERLSALEVALNNETREREFYLKHAARTTNPVGKAMFQQIGDEELEHYQRLKELHEKWSQHEKWPETVPLKVHTTVVKDVLANVVQKVDDAQPGDADDLEAVRTAIEFEAKGVAYYQKLSQMVSDPKEREFFALLSQIEHEHYLSLKDSEEFMENPVDWYRRTEHHSIDGG
jgi:rubrerythrin